MEIIYKNNFIGLAVFERQDLVKMSATNSIPKMFGTQFLKVCNDYTITPRQLDPLDFLLFFQAYREMGVSKKVNKHCLIY